MYKYVYDHTQTHTYIEWENKIVLMCLFEGTTEGGRGKENVREWKFWNKPFIYEYNIMHCNVSCWILGKHGDREQVSNGGNYFD
jgi:hypothetical protein